MTARVNRARELLETTDLQVEQIAIRCGLGSGANMRARFRDTVGVTPTAYARQCTADLVTRNKVFTIRW